jgi:endonuclease G, mitochondrial
MPRQLVRFTCFVVLLLAFCAPSLAQAGGCDPIFVNGQPPALRNARLAQRTTPLCNNAYAALASGVTRGPLWSAEHLTTDGLASARTTARQGRFHEDERLPPDDRAVLSDYARSGYDRGHMTPSGDMPDPEAQQQSFSLANIVPQTPALNRGVWEGLESTVRRLTESHGELYVVTGPAFQGAQLQSLKGRVLVPTSTWKAVYDPAVHGTAAYMCTNVSRPDCTTLSIAALVLAVGVDPFPGVPDVIKQAAMRLPPPEPSRYAPAGQERKRHRHQRHGLLDPLFQ